MRIYVTQKDIDLGQPNNSRYCPVALALKRRLKKQVLVNNKIWIGPENCLPQKMTATALPPEVKKFINKFDKKGPVQPFSFSLMVPAQNCTNDNRP